MRKLAASALLGLLAVMSACAPKIVNAPVVTAPKFPEFARPTVPSALEGDQAAVGYDRGWRFLQAGDLRNADHELSAALQVSPAFYPAEAALGYLDLARKDPKGALTRFDRALEGHAAYTSALVGRAETLLVLNREPEAIGAFDAAVAADPSLVDIRRRVEVMKFRGVERDLAAARDAARADRLDEAVRNYQSAIASSPDSAFLYRELGAVERQKGDTSAALGTFRQAVALDAGDAASQAQVGDLLDAAGDRDGALAAYNRSLAIETDAAVETRRDALVARAELARLPDQYRAIDASAQITRADLAALIAVRLGPVLQAMRTSDPGVVTDVRNHWAEPWIMSVTRAGVMEPYANHTFQPRTIVRRTDLAQAIGRLVDRIATPAQLRTWQAAGVKFVDLAETHLAYPAASVAVASGVMAVASDRAFQPSQVVSGAEAIQAIDRLRTMAAVADPANPRR